MTPTRCLFFWEGSGLELGRANPYGALLASALRRHGVELTEGNYEFGRAWLEQSRAAYDVLHLNWLDRFYARFGEPRDADAAGERFADFTEKLIHARRLGYRLIWTVHNLFPHERRYPHLDRLVNALVAREADHVIAHCRFAADSIEGALRSAAPGNGDPARQLRADLSQYGKPGAGTGSGWRSAARASSTCSSATRAATRGSPIWSPRFAKPPRPTVCWCWSCARTRAAPA